MKRSTPLLIACCLMSWALSLPLVVPSMAEETFDLDALRKERKEEQERYHLRALTQKRLNAAVELMDEGQYDEARSKLERLNPERLNAYERALVFRYLGKVTYGQEDSVAAVGYFQQVLDQHALLIDEEASVRFNIAQIQASLERWEEVDETLS